MAASIEGSLRQADTHLTIHLNPPELGRVFIRFQQEQDQITILLEVSKPQTRREIDLALPQIMRSLQDAGVQVRRLEVSAPSGSDELQQQPDTGAPGQNNGEMSPHDFAGQDDSDPDRIGAAHSNTSDEESFHEWLTSAAKDHYQDESAQPLAFTGGSINVLI
jgi:flagellar hook-length control protein FliK